MPIPAGVFTMGSPLTDTGRSAAEGPETRVTISRPFWLGQTEVTQAQWRAVMGTNIVEQARRVLADDAIFNLNGKQGTLRDILQKTRESDPRELVLNGADDAPIYWVSWDEAGEFCRKLTERERIAGRLPAGYEYRLPTEAEWEYACRAGTTAATYAGEMVVKGRNDAPVLDDIAWYGGNSSVGYTDPGVDTANMPGKQYPGGSAGPRTVAAKRPNAWGLYDMLGNVWEMCGDFWADKLPGGNASDPTGPLTGSFRLIRGGAWDLTPGHCRSPYRVRSSSGKRINNIGFRVALGVVH